MVIGVDTARRVRSKENINLKIISVNHTIIGNN